MSIYTLHNGETATAAQVHAAFAAGKAVLVHNWADDTISTGLMLDGLHSDTRGECQSVWDEVWTTAPATFEQALFHGM